MGKPVNKSTKRIISVSAKNKGQKEVLRAISNSKITLVTGAPGTGKTHLGVAWGLQELSQGRFDKLILTRPIVEAGESLGFLPGDAEQKIAPYMFPMLEILGEYLSTEDINKMINNKVIMILPIAYMRGTAQPLDEPVATPEGWKPMGDIKPGDYVIGSNGESVLVSETFFHEKKKTYRIIFSDGSWTRCCDEHLWFTQTLSEKRHNKPGSVKSTAEIMSSIKTRFGQKNHEIPIVSEPIQFAKRENPTIDPYVLGVLLGDGSLHEQASISFTTADAQIVDDISSRLPDDVEVKYASEYSYRIIKKDSSIKASTFREKLNSYGLIGTKSHNKFVPDDFKYGSPDTRIEILKGLLDADGWVSLHHSGKARVSFCSTSKRLAEDVIEIVQSLGGTASLRLRKFEKKTTSRMPEGHKWKKTGDISSIWIVEIVSPGFNPFRLSRKADMFSKAGPARCKRLISNIEYEGELDSQCISVESNDNLYITRNCIVTHNTFKNACVIVDESQNTTIKQIHLLLTRIGENSKMILAGDTDQTDLDYRKERFNGLRDAVKRLAHIEGVSHVNLGYDSCVREEIVNLIDEAYRNHYEDFLDPPVSRDSEKESETEEPASFNSLLARGELDDLMVEEIEIDEDDLDEEIDDESEDRYNVD